MNKKVIYTALFGKFRYLRQNIIPKDYDYLVFSDKQIEVSNGRLIYMALKNGENPLIKSLQVRNLGLDIIELKQYDILVWVDATVRIEKNIHPLLKELEKDSHPAFFQHIEFDNLKQEYERCKDLEKADPQNLKRQYEFYKNEGFNGKDLIMFGFLFRKRNKKTEEMMQILWVELEKWNWRNQMCWNYLAWKHNFEFTLINRKLFNEFLNWNKKSCFIDGIL